MINTYGLDQNNLNTQTTPGQSSPSVMGMFGNYGGGMTPGNSTTTYNDQNGMWTQGNNGSWVGANGQTVGDLAGYLNMKGQQKSGSDFGTYQNRLQQLLTDPNSIQQTPGYQFTVDQGVQARERGAAANHMLNSGNVLADLTKFGQGMASQQYDTQTNRLADLMRSSQNFGVQSGYFQPPQSLTPGQGSVASRQTYYKPSTW